MKNITVIATFQARAGKEAELKKVLVGSLAPTRKESGCVSYDMHQGSDDPAKFLFYETWQSKEALDLHMRTPHIQKLIPRVGELCVAFPEIRIWAKID